MNTEPHIEVIIGTMFSGKSTELMRRINRYEVIDKKIQLFKPADDDRYSVREVVSHDGMRKEVIYVPSLEELIRLTRPDTEVLGIDEAQFFESRIVKFCDDYANRGGIAIVSVLLKDYRDRFFEFRDGKADASELIRIADSITPLKALCKFKIRGKSCGQETTKVQRLIDGEPAPPDSPLKQIGGTESYSPRCRKHFKTYD